MSPAAAPEDVVVLSSSMSGGGGTSAGEEAATGNGTSKRGKKQQSRDSNEEEVKKKKEKPKRNKEGRNAAAASAVADASCSFPMSRVWRLVRSEGSNSTTAAATRTTPDAIFLINKASEMFLELFAEDAFSNAKKRRKKDINYDSLGNWTNPFLMPTGVGQGKIAAKVLKPSSTVHDVKRYEFLSDFVPEKLRAEDALKARESVET